MNQRYNYDQLIVYQFCNLRIEQYVRSNYLRKLARPISSNAKVPHNWGIVLFPKSIPIANVFLIAPIIILNPSPIYRY